MKHLKKALSVFLAIVLVFSCAPLSGISLFGTASASSGSYSDEDGNYSYSLDDDDNAIIEWINRDILTGDYSIPDSIDGYTVVDMDTYIDCENLTSLTIPSRFTGYLSISGADNIEKFNVKFGNQVYYTDKYDVLYKRATNGSVMIGYPGANGKDEYIMPDDVKSCNYSAFGECPSLKSLTIGKACTSIYIGYCCSSLEEIKVSSGNTQYTSQDGVLFSGKTLIKYPSQKAATSYTIPDNTKNIYSYAFYDVANLKEITIPESADFTFDYSGCNALETIYLNGGLVSTRNNEHQPKAIITGPNNSNYIHNSEGLLISAESGSLIWAPKGFTSLSIPEGVTYISDNVFKSSMLESVVFPSTLKKIDYNAFGNSQNLTSVTFNDGLEEIYDYAFSNCCKLNNVVFPSSLNYIGYEAFYNCDELTSINIPASVSNIGRYSFESCNKLADISIESGASGINSSAFYYTAHYMDNNNWNEDGSIYSVDGYLMSVFIRENTVFNIPEGTKGIASNALKSYAELTSVTVPDNCSIDSGVFGNFGSITSLTLGKNVKIGSDAFYNTGITSLVIPDGCSIGSAAFKNCSSLISVSIGNNVTIERSAFCNCTKLARLSLPAGTTIGADAFYNTGITSLNIPNNCSIESEAFSNCNKLKSVSMGNNVSAGSYAFSYCSALEDVSVGSGFTGANSNTFRETPFLSNFDDYENGIGYLGNCIIKINKNYTGTVRFKDGIEDIGDLLTGTMISGVVIPDSVKTIDDGAFAGCVNLKNVTLGNGIEEIEEIAFLGCISLTSINIPASVKEIGMAAFALCTSLEEITIPAATEEIGMLAFSGCTDAKEYKVDAANKNFKSINGMLYSADGKHLIAYPCGTNATSLVIPEGTVTSELTFVSCSNIRSVTIPKSFTLIDSDSLFDAADSGSEDDILFHVLFSLLNIISSKIETEEVEEFAKKIVDKVVPYISNTDENTEFEIIKEAADIVLGVVDDVLDELQTAESKEEIAGKLYDLAKEYLGKISCDSLTEYKVAEGHPFLSSDNGALYADTNAAAEYFYDVYSGAIAKFEPGEFNGESVEEIRSELEETISMIEDYTGINLLSKILISVPSGKSGNFAVAKGTNYILPTAFLGCNLDSVSLPDSLETILVGTFILSHVGRIVIPKSIKSIDACAFSLSEFGSISFENRDKLPEIGSLSLFILDEVLGFEPSSYFSENANIPFALCFADSISLPENVEVLPDLWMALAFEDELILPENLAEISLGSIAANICLHSVDIPKSVKSIGDYAFLGDISLENVNISDRSKLKSIGKYAFSLTGCNSFYVPAGVTEIGEFALTPAVSGLANSAYGYFDAYIAQMRGDISDKTDEEISREIYAEIYDKLIGGNYYYGDSSSISYADPTTSEAPSITICKSATDISVNYCATLTAGASAINAPENSYIVWYAGDEEYRFGTDNFSKRCYENFVLQAKLYNEDGTVAAESNSVNVTIDTSDYDKIHEIYLEQFENRDIKDVILEYYDKLDSSIKNIVSWFDSAMEITVDSRNAAYCSVDGSLMSKDMTTLLKINEKADGDYTVPDGVTTIAEGAFAASKITSLSISDSVTEIGRYAFAGATSLKTVSIGRGVKSISKYAFAFCNSLENVSIPSNVTSIADDAFYSTENIDLDAEIFTITGAIDSCAYNFAVKNEIPFEEADDKPFIKVITLENTSSSVISVYGNTVINEDVEIYQDGVKIGTAKAQRNGYFEATVGLIEPVNGETYAITAKVFAGTEKETESAPVNVLFDSTVPSFVSMGIFHNNDLRKITSENLGQTIKHMSFSSSSRFSFDIKLSKFDGNKTLYVVSTVDGVSKKLPAVYDARTGKYLANGFFDPNDHSYVPGTITLMLGNQTIANFSVKVPFIIDPSGYIYEAVLSNRISDAIVSIFYKDENEEAKLWEDALNFDQTPSIITGIEGLYEWEVVEGDWKVKVEKEGYETTWTEWLHVPPEHKDVNIGLISKLFPIVKNVYGYSEGVEVEFSQYMDVETINNSTAVIKKGGTPVSGTWAPLNKEVSGADPEGETYFATKFKFTPGVELSGEYTIDIDGVINYAGNGLSNPYSGTFEIKDKIEGFNLPEEFTVVYGDEAANLVIDAGSGAAGMKVTIAQSNEYVLSRLDTVKLDDNGKALLPIVANQTGEVVLTFILEGTTISQDVTINCVLPEDVKVTGITISDMEVEISNGESYQLFATVVPDFATIQNVNWSSDNTDVATVDSDGNVQAVSSGAATISATTLDGDFVASCEVTVNPVYRKITWINDGASTTTDAEVGKPIEVLAASIKDGYTFAEWSPSIPEIMPDEDLTFTAQYTKDTYNVVFKADGHVYLSIATYFDDTITLPNPPVKEGYIFTGWSPAIPAKMPSHDLEFTAQFAEITSEIEIVNKDKFSGKALDFKTTVTFTAKVTDPVDGSEIHWFIDGKDKGTGEKYTVKEATANYTVQVKYMNGDEVFAESEVENVQINTGFFAKLIAFFRGLFKLLPVLAQSVNKYVIAK